MTTVSAEEEQSNSRSKSLLSSIVPARLLGQYRPSINTGDRSTSQASAPVSLLSSVAGSPISSDRLSFVPAPLPALPIEMHTLPVGPASRPGRWSQGRDGHPGAQQAGEQGMGDAENNASTTEEGQATLEEYAGGYTPYLGRLTAVACLGGLQFGWDTGIAAGMLVAIHEDLGHTLSAAEQEVIVSATTVGAIIGALMAGRLSDWMGRRKVMITASIFFALGSFEQAASQVVRELVLGRLLVGLGVGMASMVVPTYLGECAPPSIRGRIVAINSLLITGGQVIAYVVDAAFYSLPHGWRWMVLAGGLPALIQLIGLIYLDESPRWLISRGRHTAARHVLMRIYPLADDSAITLLVTRIEQSLGRTPSGTSAEEIPSQRLGAAGVGFVKANELKTQMRRLWSERANRKALFLACGLQASQQLIGANSILYYSSRLLLMAGFHANPNVAAIWVAVANFAGTAIALRLVDRMGRRTLLLRATAAATVALACLAIALGQIDTGDVTDSARLPDTPSSTGIWPYICLIAVRMNTFPFRFQYAHADIATSPDGFLLVLLCSWSGHRAVARTE